MSANSLLSSNSCHVKISWWLSWMQLVEPWLNMESFKMLFVKWRIYLKNVVLEQTKSLENPSSCHFSFLNDRFLGLDWTLKLLSALSKRQRSALVSLFQKWLPALCSSKLDSRPVGLRTAAAAVRSLQTEMHLHRNAAKITQKEGERKKKKRKRKHRSIWRKISHHYRLKRLGIKVASSHTAVRRIENVVLSLNTTPHRSHNRVRCSPPQKGSSAKVKSEREKKSLYHHKENHLIDSNVARFTGIEPPKKKQNSSWQNLKHNFFFFYFKEKAADNNQASLLKKEA